MPDTEHMIFIMEMIGTVAFAVSGGMVAIRKNLDLLGILVLGRHDRLRRWTDSEIW